MIVALPKKAGCVIDSTEATCEEQELDMKSLILWVAFMMLVVELIHLFLHSFFSAVQLNLQEANIHMYVYVCEYCTIFFNMLQLKM